MRKWDGKEVEATRLRLAHGPSLQKLFVTALAKQMRSSQKAFPLLWIVGGLLLVGLGIGGLLALQATPEKGIPLRVEGVIVDAETGTPVEADVYLDGWLLYSKVRSFAVEVPSGSELRVEAPGYEPWAFRFHYELKGTYRFKGPVRLVRAYKAGGDEQGAKRVLGEK